MTQEEAKYINERAFLVDACGNTDSVLIEANALAVMALDKQIGQKPILKHDVGRMHINRGNKPHEWRTIESDNWHCPVCDGFVGEHLTMPARNFSHDQQKKAFCEKCGQKIDWSKNNENN